MKNHTKADIWSSASDYQAVLSHLYSKRVTLGFDGFIDSIVRIVREKNGVVNNRYFKTSSEFGQYIISKESKNFSLELKEVTTKLGGNMPIMANALARLGPSLSCIGTLGFPRVHEAFTRMPENCTLYSYGEPGLSTALEFVDSKIMMAEMKGLDHVNWNTIREILGLEKIIELFTDRDLICILNWSELANSTDIWRGLLRDVLPSIPVSPDAEKPTGFFDLSDCSKRPVQEITEVLTLLSEFSKWWSITLGLSLNEATVVYSAIKAQHHPEANAAEMAEVIYQHLGVSKVIIHFSTGAFCRDNDGMHHRPTSLVHEPKILTGAGDNFNAGFCVGQLLGFDTDKSLELGHLVSRYYLQHGESTSLKELLNVIAVKESKVSDLKPSI